MRVIPRVFAGAFATVGVMLAATSSACPIPVYQYSLENWESDPYEFVVSHAAPLSDAEQALVDRLRGIERGEGGLRANVQVEVRRVDADGHGQAEALGEGAVLEIRYPEVHRIRQTVWSGQLTSEAVDQAIESPLRKQLGEKLAGRVSAVWILLESGDRRRDNEAAAVLKETLDRLVETIVVPSSADWGGETVEIDDNLSFEMLRLSRNDPNEQMLISMLMRSEPDLADEELIQHPMVFPVYGRGLILYALVGRGINAWTIGEAGEFLAGPCSCQIKAANPGTDLLMAMDWDRLVTPLAPAAPAPAGVGGFLRRLDEAEAEDSEETGE